MIITYQSYKNSFELLFTYLGCSQKCICLLFCYLAFVTAFLRGNKGNVFPFIFLISTDIPKGSVKCQQMSKRGQDSINSFVAPHYSSPVRLKRNPAYAEETRLAGPDPGDREACYWEFKLQGGIRNSRCLLWHCERGVCHQSAIVHAVQAGLSALSWQMRLSVED